MPCPHASKRTAAARLRGFTFIEVMFAVGILAIGLVMIAFMLPVAIRQTAQTRDATSGAAAVETGFHYIEGVANMGENPLTGEPNASPWFTGGTFQINASRDIYAAEDVREITNYTRGNRILSSDPRVAWVPFYSFDGQTLRCAVLAIRSRLDRGFLPPSPLEAGQLAGDYWNNPDNGPHAVLVKTSEGGNRGGEDVRADLIRFVGNDRGPLVAVEGAFVIIADDANATGGNLPPGSQNGQIYRVGRLRTDLSGTGSPVYELQPGWDMSLYITQDGRFPRSLPEDNWDGPGADALVQNYLPADNTNGAVWAWIVGRSLRDPFRPFDAATNPYAGPAMDIMMHQRPQVIPIGTAIVQPPS